MKLVNTLLIATLGLGLVACDKKDAPAEKPAATKTEKAAKAPVKGDKVMPNEAAAAAAAAAKAGADKVAEAAKVMPKEAAAAAAAAAAAPAAKMDPAAEEALTEKGIKLMEEMGAMVDANKDDCDKLGGALSGFADKNGATFKELKAMKPTPERDAAMKAKYGERIKVATGKMMGGMMKCQGNAKIAEAMKKM